MAAASDRGLSKTFVELDERLEMQAALVVVGGDDVKERVVVCLQLALGVLEAAQTHEAQGMGKKGQAMKSRSQGWGVVSEPCVGLLPDAGQIVVNRVPPSKAASVVAPPAFCST